MTKVVVFILVLMLSMVLAVDLQKTALEVKGMQCEDCAVKVSEALKGIQGVEKVSVDLEKGIVLIEHNGVEKADLNLAVEKAGYGKDGHNCDCRKDKQKSEKYERCCSKKSGSPGKKVN